MQRYLSFVGVGTVAAAVHFCSAVALVSLLHWSPLVANVGGYCIALAASFIGQSRLAFNSPAAGSREFVKFAATSLLGFALNSIMYAMFLRWTALDYRLALLLVLASVAALTYLLMSRWVFLQARRTA